LAADFRLRRMSPTFGYRTQPCPSMLFPIWRRRSSSFPNPSVMRYSGRREMPLGYWLTLFLFTWLSRPPILTFILSVTLSTFFFVFLLSPYFCFSIRFQLDTYLFAFCRKCVPLRTPRPHVRLNYNLILMLFIIAFVTTSPGFVLDACPTSCSPCTVHLLGIYVTLPSIEPPILPQSVHIHFS